MRLGAVMSSGLVLTIVIVAMLAGYVFELVI